MSKRKLYVVDPPNAQEVRGRDTSLPELPGRHGDPLESIEFGPRREMTVKIKPLLWAGNQGFYGPAYFVRFGGIVNYEEVLESFKPRYCQESELNAIEYDQGHFSKQGDLHLLFSFERIDTVVVIHCFSLTVTEPEPGAKKAA